MQPHSASSDDEEEDLPGEKSQQRILFWEQRKGIFIGLGLLKDFSSDSGLVFTRYRLLKTEERGLVEVAHTTPSFGSDFWTVSPERIEELKKDVLQKNFS